LDFEKAENERLRYVTLFLFYCFTLGTNTHQLVSMIALPDFVSPNLIPTTPADSFPFYSMQIFMNRTTYKSVTHHFTLALWKPFPTVSTKPTTCRNSFAVCVGLSRKQSSQRRLLERTLLGPLRNFKIRRNNATTV
jgi:hypothetical protein